MELTTIPFTPQNPSPTYSPPAGPCILLDRAGMPLGRGRLEVNHGQMRLHAVTPSGAVAAAFFGRGHRRFFVALADGSTIPVLMRDCWWQGSERVCDLQTTEIAVAA